MCLYRLHWQSNTLDTLILFLKSLTCKQEVVKDTTECIKFLFPALRNNNKMKTKGNHVYHTHTHSSDIHCTVKPVIFVRQVAGGIVYQLLTWGILSWSFTEVLFYRQLQRQVSLYM